jgi:hypothetical protein
MAARVHIRSAVFVSWGILSVLSAGMAFAEGPGFSRQAPRQVDLFPRDVLWGDIVQVPGGAPRPGGSRPEAVLATVQFSRTGDQRTRSDRDEFRLNEDGSLSVGHFFDIFQEWELIVQRSALFQAAPSCPADSSGIGPRSSRSPEEQQIYSQMQGSMAMAVLGRILDNEAMKRLVPPRVSRERARYAADSFLLQMAVQHGVLNVRTSFERRGAWNRNMVSRVNRTLEGQERAARMMGQRLPQAPAGGWKGWSHLYSYGVRPCGAPRADLPIEEVDRFAAPAEGSPVCGMVRHLECPAAGSVSTDGRPYCGMSSEELFLQMRTWAQQHPEAIGFNANISWSPLVSAMDRMSFLLEDDAHFPWESVPIRLRTLQGEYRDLVESVADLVLQGRYYDGYRRMAVWDQLVAERFPDRAWWSAFQRTQQDLQRQYERISDELVTRSRQTVRVIDIELSGPQAEDASSAMLSELDAQAPVFQSLLSQIGRGPRCADDRASATRRQMGDYYQRMSDAIRASAQSIGRRARFRGLTVNQEIRDIFAVSNGGFDVMLSARPETRYGDGLDSELNRAPFGIASMTRPAFNRHQIVTSDGRIVIRFFLDSVEEVLAREPLRLEDGRLNPRIAGRLQAAMEAKSRAILYREVAFHLFQQNRVNYNTSVCQAVNLPCVWDARAMAEQLFPEELFSGSTLPSGQTSLGDASRYPQVASISTDYFGMSVYRVRNEWDQPSELQREILGAIERRQ